MNNSELTSQGIFDMVGCDVRGDCYHHDADCPYHHEAQSEEVSIMRTPATLQVVKIG